MAALEGRKVMHGTSWRVIYWWHDRQEKVKIGITSKRVALERKSEIEALLARNINPAKSVRRHKLSVLSGLSEIDAKWCEPRRQARTLELNLNVISRLMKWCGDISLDRVDTQLVEKYLDHLLNEQSYNLNSVNIHLRTLKAMFQRAKDEHGLLKEHPFRSVKPLAGSLSPRKAVFLETKQINNLVSELDDIHLKRIIKFYLWTGCRRSEATDLTWIDIDLQSRQIYLGQSHSQTKRRRSFPLTNKLDSLLIELRADSDDSDKVFWRFAKDPRRVSRLLRTIRERVDSLPPNLTLHTLRHTFASQLVMQGVDLSTVASFLGHTTTKVTEMYSHLQPSHKLSAANKLPY